MEEETNPLGKHYLVVVKAVQEQFRTLLKEWMTHLKEGDGMFSK